MLKNTLRDKVTVLEADVFKGNIGQVPVQVIEIVQLVEEEIEEFSETFQAEWQQILNYLLIALEKKDYLLVSDICKYELMSRL